MSSQAEGEIAVKVLSWDPIQWARALRFVLDFQRMPIPTLAGARHVQVMWLRAHREGENVAKHGDELLGCHGWVYQMFAYATTHPSGEVRLRRDPRYPEPG